MSKDFLLNETNSVNIKIKNVFLKLEGSKEDLIHTYKGLNVYFN